MSGHSHYATIHRQKEIKDAQKGKAFSKLAREISIAVKAGGGPDPETNYKLRVAVERARGSNMPKENIERAISKGAGGEALEQVSYEGFGPGGVGIIVEVATDNRNRTAQEIKNIFEKGGGNLAGKGAVAFNFEPKGAVVVRKKENSEEQMLSLIDLGVEDMEEEEDVIEAYAEPERLSEVKDMLIKKGFEVESVELIQRPKTYTSLNDKDMAKRTLSLLEKFEEHDDVQKVFSNLDVAEEILGQIS